MQRHGTFVGAGPFTGMRYERGQADGGYLYRLVGSYEAELHEVIERCIMREYKTVINIGAGDGYYAVGMALLMPGVRVHAFETLGSGRRLCLELAVRNGVADRVLVHGSCSIGGLREFIQPHSLLICDCEGCELDLLCPDDLPVLRTCDVLVELHDHLNPGITPTLMERFSGSHDIELVDREARDPSRYPGVSDLSPQDVEAVLVEFRPTDQQWAFIQAREK